jgi:hypothetical protein
MPCISSQVSFPYFGTMYADAQLLLHVGFPRPIKSCSAPAAIFCWNAYVAAGRSCDSRSTTNQHLMFITAVKLISCVSSGAHPHPVDKRIRNLL